MKLTPQEVQLFRHNGFIKFPTQLSTAHVEALKTSTLKDMSEAVEPVVPARWQNRPNFRSMGAWWQSFEKRLPVMKSSILWNHYWDQI